MNPIRTTSATVVMETRLGIDEAVATLQSAAAAEQFGVVGVHHLNETMAKKGIAMDRQVRIVEMCQPGIARDICTMEPEISAALPCRVSVYERDGRNWLCTMRPTALLAMFDVPEAATAAQSVEDTILRIMARARG